MAVKDSTAVPDTTAKMADDDLDALAALEKEATEFNKVCLTGPPLTDLPKLC